jgi:hypothetical protein
LHRISRGTIVLFGIGISLGTVILYPTSYGAHHTDIEWLIGRERVPRHARRGVMGQVYWTIFGGSL